MEALTKKFLSRCHGSTQIPKEKGSESRIKAYKRNRSETLSLRLSREEKRQLNALAAKRDMSLTDYILLSALRYSPAESYRPLLKKLDQLHAELTKLRKENGSDAVCDALERQARLYDEVLAAIRSA